MLAVAVAHHMGITGNRRLQTVAETQVLLLICQYLEKLEQVVQLQGRVVRTLVDRQEILLVPASASSLQQRGKRDHFLDLLEMEVMVGITPAASVILFLFLGAITVVEKEERPFFRAGAEEVGMLVEVVVVLRWATWELHAIVLSPFQVVVVAGLLIFRVRTHLYRPRCAILLPALAV